MAEGLAGKAEVSHTHGVGDITGLLDGSGKIPSDRMPEIVDGLYNADVMLSDAPTKYRFLSEFNWNIVGNTSNTYQYFKEVLKRICKLYPNDPSLTTYFFLARPGVGGLGIVMTYDNNVVNNEGLPCHSGGIAVVIGGTVYTFGTVDYKYEMRDVSTTNRASDAGGELPSI